MSSLSSWLPKCTPASLISASPASDASSISVSQLRVTGRGKQSELAFQLSTEFPGVYMPWRQKTFCAYCQYRYFHSIYAYINTESAETHRLVQHEKVWNKEWWEGQWMYPCLFSRTLLSLRNSMCANTVKWPPDLSSYLCTSSHRLTIQSASQSQTLKSSVRENSHWSLAEGKYHFVQKHWICSSSCELSNPA